MSDIDPILGIDISFKGASTAAHKDACLQVFPDAYVHDIVCLSENPPVTVLIVLDVAATLKIIGLSGLVSVAAGLFFKGKSIHESLQGWKGTWNLITGGKTSRIELLHQKLARLQSGGDLQTRLGVNFAVEATPRFLTVWPAKSIPGDDFLAIIALSQPSIERPLKKLQGLGVRWSTASATVEFDPETFRIEWKAPSGIQTALFDHAGAMIGDILDLTKVREHEAEELIARLKERMQCSGESLGVAVRAIEAEIPSESGHQPLS